MTHLPPVNLLSYRRFLEEIFDMIGDKTLCANAQRCTNGDCIRHPKPLTREQREDPNYWRRIHWIDYHLPSNGITCKYRQEEPK